MRVERIAAMYSHLQDVNGTHGSFEFIGKKKGKEAYCRAPKWGWAENFGYSARNPDSSYWSVQLCILQKTSMQNISLYVGS